MSVNNPAPSPAGPTAISNVGLTNSYPLNSVTVTPTSNTGKKLLTSMAYPASSTAAVSQASSLQTKDAIKRQVNVISTAVPSTTKVIANYPNVASPVRPPPPTKHGKHQLPVVPIGGYSSLNSSIPRLNPTTNSFSSSGSAFSEGSMGSSSSVKPITLATKIQPLTQMPVQFQSASSIKTNTSGAVNKPIISLSVSRPSQTPLIVRSIGTSLQNPSIGSNSQDSPRRFSSVTHQPTTTISITVPARAGQSQDSNFRSAQPHASNNKQATAPSSLLVNTPTVIVSSSNSIGATKTIAKMKVHQRASISSSVRSVNLSSGGLTTSTGTAPFNFSSAANPRRVTVTTITTAAIPVAKVYTQPVRIHGMAGSASSNQVAITPRYFEAMPSSTAVAKPSSMITITSALSSITTTSTSATSKISSASASFPAQVIHHPGTTSSSSSGGGCDQQVRIIPAAPVPSAAHSPSPLHNMSPKTNMPNILRRPPRQHNVVSDGITVLPTQKSRFHQQTHELSGGIKTVIPISANVAKPVLNSNGMATVPKIQKPPKEFAVAMSRTDKETIRLPQQTIGEIKIKSNDQHITTLRAPQTSVIAESASSHLAQQQQLLAQHSATNSAPSPSASSPSLGSRNKTLTAAGGGPYLAGKGGAASRAHPPPIAPPTVTRGGLVVSRTIGYSSVQAVVANQQQPQLQTATALLHNPSSSSVIQQQVLPPAVVSSASSFRASNNVAAPTRPPIGAKRDYDTMMTPANNLSSPPHRHHDPDGKSVLLGSSVVSVYPGIQPSSSSAATGLSPRKKPRKQKHVVAEELPDDELTDDAPESEKGDKTLVMATEPATPPFSPPFSSSSSDGASMLPPVTSSALMPLSSQPLSSTSLSSSSDLGKISDKADKPKVSMDKTGDDCEAPSSPPASSEYVDNNGVRYIPVKPRLYSLMSNVRPKPLNNHFQRYTDIKIKPEKRPTLNDACFDKKRFGLYEFGMFALQLNSLIEGEAALQERFKKMHDGLLEYCDEVTNSGHDIDPWEAQLGEGCLAASGLSSKFEKSDAYPVTASISSNSISHNFGFTKKPYYVRGAVSTDIHTVPTVQLANLNGRAECYEKAMSVADKSSLRLRNALLRVDEKILANKQRCSVVKELLESSKSKIVEGVRLRSDVLKIIDAGRLKQKAPNKSNNSSSSRGAKKKKGL